MALTLIGWNHILSHQIYSFRKIASSNAYCIGECQGPDDRQWRANGSIKSPGAYPRRATETVAADRLDDKGLLFVGGTIDEPCIQAVYWRFRRLSISHAFCCSHARLQDIRFSRSLLPSLR